MAIFLLVLASFIGLILWAGPGNWFLMTVLNENNEKLFTIPSWGLHVGDVYMQPMKGGEQLS